MALGGWKTSHNHIIIQIWQLLLPSFTPKNGDNKSRKRLWKEICSGLSPKLQSSLNVWSKQFSYTITNKSGIDLQDLRFSTKFKLCLLQLCKGFMIQYNLKWENRKQLNLEYFITHLVFNKPFSLLKVDVVLISKIKEKYKFIKHPWGREKQVCCIIQSLT